MSQNRFWYLLAKKLSGEALPAEVSELEQLVKENPDWVYAAEHIESLWKLKANCYDPLDAELAFAQHLEHQKKNGLNLSHLDTPVDEIEESIPHKTNKLRSFSLILIVLVAIAGIIWKTNSGKHTDAVPLKHDSEVSTKLANKTKLVLPDSTIVWLNSGSRLTYNEQFGIAQRNATLSGEAYFEVKKNSIPFIIHANNIEIKVLGTIFNVKSYPDDKTTETTLIRGRVEVSLDKRPGQKFILKPNEKLIVANDMEEVITPLASQKKEPMVVLSSLTHNNDDNIIETAWVNNKLIFQDESLEDMARKMERWYNVTIEIPNEKIARMHVTGTFENETVKQALDALQIAFKFNYSIQQDKIVITE
jgi:transmembrane sensor